MRISVCLFTTLALTVLSDEIPLRNGKVLRGTVVGCILPAVKIKTETGNIIECPLTHVSPDAITNLPEEVSAPYRDIAYLKALLHEQTETYLKGIGSIRQIVEDATATPAETEDVDPPAPQLRPKVSAKNATARLVDDLYGYVTVSWKTDVHAKLQSHGTVEFLFIDSKGFTVSQTYSNEMVFKTGSTAASGTHMMTSDLWKQVKRFDAVIHLFE